MDGSRHKAIDVARVVRRIFIVLSMSYPYTKVNYL
jgi:hypothetical protein